MYPLQKGNCRVRNVSHPFLPLCVKIAMTAAKHEAGPSRALRRLPAVFAVLGMLVAPVLVVLDVLQQHKSLSLHRNEAEAARAVRWSSWSNDVDQLSVERDLLSRCKEKWISQRLDHFDVGSATFEQRYFVCDEFFRHHRGAMFFYTGNEANVELYLNHSGLMWENAQHYGAMLVFAEHRYFGESLPFGENVTKHMQFLSTEQALADYAELITHIKRHYKREIPVIGFGGSYGGMLASWFRMKYPNIMDGAIAGSAPVLSFLGDTPRADMGAFSRIVTYDATPGAGAARNCVTNIRRVWTTIASMGATTGGREQTKEVLRLCGDTKVDTSDDVLGVMEWAKAAFDMMAMGNYPYPSSYIMNGKGVLPAYPMRAACAHLDDSFGADDASELLQSFARSIGVYYNSTGDKECFDLSASSNESARDADFWQYLYCSELYMPMKVDGINDMFWPAPWNRTADNESCMAQWGVEVQPMWANTQYGGRKALKAASNIVFSNGNYDPWSGTGVLETFSDSVVSVMINGGAHHLDLMFSHQLDTDAVKAARATELDHIAKWIREFYDRVDCSS